jgi:hypothetical protein
MVLSLLSGTEVATTPINSMLSHRWKMEVIPVIDEVS